MVVAGAIRPQPLSCVLSASLPADATAPSSPPSPPPVSHLTGRQSRQAGRRRLYYLLAYRCRTTDDHHCHHSLLLAILSPSHVCTDADRRRPIESNWAGICDSRCVNYTQRSHALVTKILRLNGLRLLISFVKFQGSKDT
ncbi:hypothetical protein ZWY2020_014202 [Hordeum vulgare]|nr:hypothetical protein ZWY2020_014202 [Hordeum vulgare]